jgi:hypothetical protein
MTPLQDEIATLYRASAKTVAIIEVPDLQYAMLAGAGPPAGADFAAAIQALYSVSYAAHFAVKKASGQSTKIMPLEAQWWVQDQDQEPRVTGTAFGSATLTEANQQQWRWQALIMQPEPITAELMSHVLQTVRNEKGLPALDRLRFDRWQEGRCAQILHIGPYAEEGPTIHKLHAAIAEAGYQPRGRHHEIYLGDPRRSAPERLRTILRQPVEHVRSPQSHQ